MTTILFASLLFAGTMLAMRLLGTYIERHAHNAYLTNVTVISLVAVAASTLLSVGLVAIGIVISEHGVPLWEIAGLFIGINVGGYYLFPILKSLMASRSDMSDLMPA